MSGSCQYRVTVLATFILCTPPEVGTGRVGTICTHPFANSGSLNFSLFTYCLCISQSGADRCFDPLRKPYGNDVSSNTPPFTTCFSVSYGNLRKRRFQQPAMSKNCGWYKSGQFQHRANSTAIQKLRKTTRFRVLEMLIKIRRSETPW